METLFAISCAVALMGGIIWIFTRRASGGGLLGYGLPGDDDSSGDTGDFGGDSGGADGGAD